MWSRIKNIFSINNPFNIGKNINARSFSSQAEQPTSKNDKWRHFYNEFAKDFRDLSHELERRKYNKRVIIFAGIGIFGFATYGFFRNWASKEVVLISSKTFEDDKFKKTAITFAKEGIKELCESPEV